jgi:hypothetical protein
VKNEADENKMPTLTQSLEVFIPDDDDFKKLNEFRARQKLYRQTARQAAAILLGAAAMGAEIDDQFRIKCSNERVKLVLESLFEKQGKCLIYSMRDVMRYQFGDLQSWVFDRCRMEVESWWRRVDPEILTRTGNEVRNNYLALNFRLPAAEFAAGRGTVGTASRVRTWPRA